MPNKNIVLVGFMGSGKTLVANKLGSLLKREVISTDHLVEQKEKRRIIRIFQESGEAYFRQVERDVVREVSLKRGVILDCGGGVVLDPDNVTNLKKNGVLIYLSASAEAIWERVKGKKYRPLLDVEDPKAKIKELLDAREPFYKQADHMVDTHGKSVAQICREIMSLMKDDE